MSIINKLSIRGIRSFGTLKEDEQVSWNVKTHFMILTKKNLSENHILISSDAYRWWKRMRQDNGHWMSQVCIDRWHAARFW